MLTKKLIIGNWKMNPASPADAKKTFAAIVAKAGKTKKVETVICPPAVFLNLFSGKKGGIKLGAQDAFYETEGAFTGFVSAKMLKNLGALYVIVGHSERRAAGETDEIVNKKIKAALSAGFIAILCVGEVTHDENGAYLNVIKDQLEKALAGIPKRFFDRIVIAHEPVWAIGKEAKSSDSPESFEHNRLFIRRVLSDLVGKKIGAEIPVLYGGSVNVKNAAAFLQSGKADGLLVGRASLIPQDFAEITRIASLTT